MPNFLELLISSFRTNAARNALILPDAKVSYQDLWDRSCLLAARFQELAVQCGKQQIRVGILVSRSLESYSSILACLLSGSAYIPINPKQPKERIKKILALAAPDLVLPDENTLRCAPPGTAATRDGFAAAALMDSTLAYIIFTSGSTGIPKGVMVSRANLNHIILFALDRFKLNAQDRASQFYELSFDLSLLDMLLCWCSGACLYVVPEKELLQPAKFIQDNQLTLWSSVPSVINLMQRLKVLKPDCFPSLRFSLFGGETFGFEAYKSWQSAAPHSRIDNVYGPSEVTVACSFQQSSDPPLLTVERNSISIGKAVSGLHVGVMDQQQKFLGPDEVGELCFSGPQVSLGYLNNEAETKRKYIMLKHPKLGESRWYLSGDVGYQDSRGNLHLLGRVDNQIKYFGHRIELEEIELHLAKAANVQVAACVAWPLIAGAVNGIVGFVENTKLNEAQIMQNLKEHLPAHMLPQRIVLKQELPLNLNGKIDRQALVSELQQKD